MEVLKKIQNRVDELNLRERGIVLAGIIVVIYFLFDLFIYQPLEVSQKRIQNALILNNSEVVVLNSQLQGIIKTSPDDKEAQNKQEIQRLRKELAALDQELKDSTANLVTPQQMPRLLQMVLAQTDGLRLKSVKGLGSTPLLPAEKSKGKTDSGESETGPGAQEIAGSTAFKHGLQIEFEGDYFTTLDYLKKLEALEWNFFWDNIEYKVKEYPEATSTLSLYTISLDKNWIGV